MGKGKRSQLSGLWCVLCIAGCFVIGGVLGCLLGAFAGEVGAGETERYLRDFLALARTQEISWTLPAVLWNRGRWLLCCGLFGLSAVGIVILPVLFGVRGFLLAFGVSCFVRAFGAVGLLPAVLLFGIPALLWAPGFLMLGMMCLRRSAHSVCKSELQSGGEVRKGIGAAGLFLILCVLFECCLLPRLLSAAAGILE